MSNQSGPFLGVGELGAPPRVPRLGGLHLREGSVLVNFRSDIPPNKLLWGLGKWHLEPPLWGPGADWPMIICAIEYLPKGDPWGLGITKTYLHRIGGPLIPGNSRWPPAL